MNTYEYRIKLTVTAANNEQSLKRLSELIGLLELKGCEVRLLKDQESSEDELPESVEDKATAWALTKG